MKCHYAVLVTMIVLFATNSQAQHGHDEGHYNYSNWSSKKTANCCNNQDCGYLIEGQDWRETAQGDEVKILGQWCPVKPEHYITRGKSPDWTKAHACINLDPNLSPANVCDRLLCFAGMPSY